MFCVRLLPPILNWRDRSGRDSISALFQRKTLFLAGRSRDTLERKLSNFLSQGGNFLSRRLDFILNPVTSAIPYWRPRHGLDTPLLPILERIHALTGDTPQLVSVPAQSRWIMRAFIGLTLLLVAVMLMRLLTRF